MKVRFKRCKYLQKRAHYTFYTLSMNTPETQLAIAIEHLSEVSAQLHSARKELRRDWEQLQPRERSEQSRRVKALEAQESALQEEIDLKSSELNRLT